MVSCVVKKILFFTLVLFFVFACYLHADNADYDFIAATHPRLLVNQDNINAIRGKIGGDLNVSYIAYKEGISHSPGKLGWDYVNSNPEDQTALSAACAFVYLMDGDISWTSAPIQSALTSHGFSYGNDGGGHCLEMYAMVYDWLYDVLTESDKAIIRNNIANIADSFLANYNNEIKLDDYHNYMTQWINGMMMAGLAIYHDDTARGKNYLDWARGTLYLGHDFISANEENKTWNFKESMIYSGGYCDFEGLGYFKNAIPEVARAIEAWDSATRRHFNMWSTHFSLMLNSAYYVIYAFCPDNKMAKFEDINPMSTYVSARYMTLLTLLEGRFNDGYIKSFIDAKYAGVKDWLYGGIYKVYYFVFYDPAVTTADFTALPVDRKTDNYYFMKSGWGMNDTMVGFKAGTHYGYHSHSTHNGFFIWDKGNILTAEGGMYESNCQTFDDPSKNMTAWNRQTVASNGITVFDPEDVYVWNSNLGTILPNAGGQRMEYLRRNPPFNQYLNYSNMPWSGYMIGHDSTTAELFKYADVKAWETTDNFCYIRSDASKAYANNYSGTGSNPLLKTGLIEREFVYIKPGYIVTYDRIKTTSAFSTKSYIIHSIGSPSVYDTVWNTPMAGISDYASAHQARMDSGTSRLFLKTIYPTNVRYHVVGGSGYENFIEATATNYQPNCEVQDYNMRWRIEVQPTGGQVSCNFLNFIEIADTSRQDITASSAIVTGSNVQGLAISGSFVPYVIIFSTSENSVNNLAYSAPAGGKHLLFDIAAGSYDIFLNNTKVFSSLEPSSQGCLSFDAAGNPGNYQVVQSQNDIRPPAPPQGLELK